MKIHWKVRITEFESGTSETLAEICADVCHFRPVMYL